MKVQRFLSGLKFVFGRIIYFFQAIVWNSDSVCTCKKDRLSFWYGVFLCDSNCQLVIFFTQRLDIPIFIIVYHIIYRIVTLLCAFVIAYSFAQYKCIDFTLARCCKMSCQLQRQASPFFRSAADCTKTDQNSSKFQNQIGMHNFVSML